MVELKVSWDDTTCKLIHEKSQQKSYHGDMNYHMKLVTTFDHE